MPEQSMKEVTAVVVNWNGAEFLPRCLRSIAGQRDVTTRAIVVDNGSTDGSLDLLAREFPEVHVLRHEPNNYTAANNAGVAAAATDLVLILNTDAWLQPDCLAKLAAALAADPRAAGAAPRILFPNGRMCTTGIRERSDLYWVDRDQGRRDPGSGGAVEEVFGISGCCALFRRQAWDAVGGQDTDFHMYYEDVDLSLRLRAAGWKLLYVPAAEAVHVGHGSIAKAPKWKDELGERNRLLVLARHYPHAFAGELVRSPWLEGAGDHEVVALVGQLGARLRERGGDARGEALLEALGRGERPLRKRPRWSLRRRLRKIAEGLRRRL